MLNADEIRIFMSFFKGSSKAFMEQQSNGGYFPKDRSLEEVDIRDHLKGEKTLGVYVVEPEVDTVNFLALDIDKKDQSLLRALFEAAFEIGIKDNQVLIEDSGNKGWHIWIPFANPTPANKARTLGEIIVSVSKTKEIIEIFPKQIRVAQGGYGNGIKLPLGKHKKTGNFSFFIDPDTFQELEPNQFTFIHKVTESEIEVMLEEFPEISKPKFPLNPALNSPKNVFNCINTILKGVSEGNRDIALFNLVIHFLKEKKLPKNAVFSILNDWNRSNNPPLSTDLIENKINYISNSDKYTHFSCSQLKPFCSPDCPKLNKSNKVPEKKKNIKTSLYHFPDGRMAEMVLSPEKGSLLAYLDSQTNAVVYAHTLEVDGQIIRPFAASEIPQNAILFPSEAAEYGSQGALMSEIMAFIHKYLDIDSVHEKICAYFILFTYFFDRFDITPYLRFTGDYGSGKSRAWKTIGGLCYKTIICSGATTASPIFRFIDIFQSVLAIDEADMKSSELHDDITKILNTGYSSEGRVLRSEVGTKSVVPKAYNCFCPKILITRESFKDQALESRCLTITMRGRKRDDIPLNINNLEFNQDALRVRNMLLMYRLRNYQNVSLKEHLKEGSIEDRFNQIMTPLLSVVNDTTHQAEIVEFMKETNQEIKDNRTVTYEFDALEAINELLAVDARVKLADIAESVNKKNPEDEKVSPRKIGTTVREKLKLRTKRESRGTYLVYKKEEIEKLNKRFGVVPSEMNV